MSSDPFYYRFVPEDEVPELVLRAARKALAVSEARLGLTGVKIKWCKPERKASYELEELQQKVIDIFDRMIGNYSCPIPKSVQKGIQGEFHGCSIPLSYPKTIILRVDVKPERIILTVAHECQHLRDWAQDPSSWAYPNKTEERAEEFEQEIAAALGMEGC
jgi:hypothetical protein